MTAARFSPFELLLLQSRNQADSAALLLLAWVLTRQGPVGDAERARLAALTGAFRHGHSLPPLLEIAARQDLGAIQLAAEVLRKELHGDTSRAFLRLAVSLATEHAAPTLANHHILRFLADLLGVAPAEFAELYASQAGRALREPGDPSRQDYWQRRERGARRHHREPPPGTAGQEAGDAGRRRARDDRAAARRRAREARAQAKHEQRQARERTRARQRAEREAERARQQAEREARRQRRRSRRQRQRGPEADPRQRAHGPGASQVPPGGTAADPRVRSALSVLGLAPGASRSEIRRAYRRLAQAHHPDRFHREGEAIVASASRRFQRIRKAYDFLMKVS